MTDRITPEKALEAMQFLADLAGGPTDRNWPHIDTLRRFIQEAGEDAQRWCALRDSLPPINRSHTEMPLVCPPLDFERLQTYTADGLVKAVDEVRSARKQESDHG